MTALLLAAAALGGAIRQLWSALWRERPAAATSPMRERAEVTRSVPGQPPPVARRAPVPSPRRVHGDVGPEREQRSVRAAATSGEPHSDFEVSSEAETRPADDVARPERLELRR